MAELDDGWAIQGNGINYYLLPYCALKVKLVLLKVAPFLYNLL